MGSTLVDDTNPDVQYQPGWIWEQGVAEVDATRHGAAIAGLRAWLTFSGTGVRVVGTLGPSDTYGQPQTTYLLDGVAAGTYSAPHTPSGQIQYNVTFFEARGLADGRHVVTVENTDGTAPNTFWLDFIEIDPEGSVTPVVGGGGGGGGTQTQAVTVTQTQTKIQTQTQGQGQGQGTTQPSGPGQSSNSSPSPTKTAGLAPSNASSSGASTPASSGSHPLTAVPNASIASSSAASGAGNSSVSVQYVTSVNGDATVVSTISFTFADGAPAQTSAAGASVNGNTSTSPNGTGTGQGAAAEHGSRTNVGLIAGAVVAGVAVLAVLVVLFLCLRRRRRAELARETPAPFSYSRNPPQSRDPPPMRHAGYPNNTLAAERHFDPESPNSPYSEYAPESAVSLAESYTHSAASETGLLTAQRRSSILSPSNYRPPPSWEKGPSAPSPSSPDTPSLGFTNSRGPPSESVYSTDPPRTPGSRSSGTATLVPPSVIPPGAWHAPPDSHGRAQTLLRSLFSRGSRAGSVASVPRDVDSGLRLYDDVVLPPPYTQD